MTEERREPAPLFAFELTEASAQHVDHFSDPHRLHIRPEVGAAFVWVHVGLSRPCIADWLAHLPIDKEIGKAISTPGQRGRLFVENDLRNGQLRDVRRPRSVDRWPVGLAPVASDTLNRTNPRESTR